jgi:hypothetical protein
MATYSTQDGSSRIELDPSTVTLLNAMAAVSLRPTKELATQAVELLRPVLVPSTKAKNAGAR